MVYLDSNGLGGDITVDGNIDAGTGSGIGTGFASGSVPNPLQWRRYYRQRLHKR